MRYAFEVELVETGVIEPNVIFIGATHSVRDAIRMARRASGEYGRRYIADVWRDGDDAQFAMYRDGVRVGR